jgi:integrase/recombinase XerC
MVKDDAITNFLSYLRLQKRFSALTIKSYTSDLSQFFGHLDENLQEYDLDRIKHTHIRSFIAHLMEQGFSASSVNRKISTLRSFFKYLLKNEVISQNPTQKALNVKMPKRLPVFVDEDQMGKIFSTVEFGSDFEGIRDKLILDLLYQTGIRRSELIGLTESDVDIFNMQLKVLGKRNKERIIPFDVNLKRNLETYLRVKKEQKLMSPYLLVTKKDMPMNPALVTRVVKQVLTEVTTGQKKSPHVLRHTFATHILNNGADINAVKELLGHASLAATQVYTHNSIDKLKKMYNQAHPRSGN